jgi:hypothetical protein
MRKYLSYPILIGSLSLSISVFANIATSWKIDDISRSTGYTVVGENKANHQFGLVKHSNTCGSDELYVSWSSNSAEIWSLAGQTIEMDAEFDGISMSLPLEVVAIRPLVGDRHEVIMGHVFANPELLDLMTSSATVNIFIPAGNSLSRHFNNNSDRFPLSGFKEARAEALKRCYSKSS